MSAKPPRQSSSSARRAADARAKQQATMRAARKRSLAMIGVPLVLVLIGAAVFVSRVVPRTHIAVTAIPTTAASATIAAAAAAASSFVAGAPIDGVQCGAAEGQTQHVHQHFDVVINVRISRRLHRSASSQNGRVPRILPASIGRTHTRRMASFMWNHRQKIRSCWARSSISGPSPQWIARC